MSRPKTAQDQSPTLDTQTSGFVLPPNIKPRVASYAPGPFITPDVVTPSDWSWRNVRTYTVTAPDGVDYRCVRVTDGPVLVGYWAIEQLGEPLFSDHA